jgi:hypothetical protein
MSFSAKDGQPPQIGCSPTCAEFAVKSGINWLNGGSARLLRSFTKIKGRPRSHCSAVDLAGFESLGFGFGIRSYAPHEIKRSL